MPPKSRNGIPAYQRIQGSIRKRIEAGELRTGDAVASERDLAKIHQVSLMTARHALISLERDYQVELGYADEEVDATAADPRSAELLGIHRGDPLLRIRQLIHSTNGKPVLYVLGLYRSDRHKLLIRRFR